MDTLLRRFRCRRLQSIKCSQDQTYWEVMRIISEYTAGSLVLDVAVILNSDSKMEHGLGWSNRPGIVVMSVLYRGTVTWTNKADYHAKSKMPRKTHAQPEFSPVYLGVQKTLRQACCVFSEITSETQEWDFDMTRFETWLSLRVSITGWWQLKFKLCCI